MIVHKKSLEEVKKIIGNSIDDDNLCKILSIQRNILHDEIKELPLLLEEIKILKEILVSFPNVEPYIDILDLSKTKMLELINKL
ncbi:MAG: hypothetical protein M0R17_04535 [Candidatus Omnitrophica bacterium]|jgi:hypothetical protein|nr:hypothetical protein [Candidatus Omnitrophota bacterium]